MPYRFRPAAAVLTLLLAACGGGEDRPEPASGSSTGGANPCCTGQGGGAGAGAGGTGTQTGGSGGAGGSTNNSGGTSSSGGTAGAAGSLSSGGSGAGGACGGVGSATCPPEGPYGGGSEGSVVPDLTVYDCDGNPVTLHTLCDNQAAAVFTFAAWCSVCKAHMNAGQPQALYEKYRNESFEMYVVVTQKTNGTTADAALCQAVKDQYGLQMPVLFDRDNVLTTELGMAANSGALVMTGGNQVTLRQSYGFDEMVSELEKQLCF